MVAGGHSAPLDNDVNEEILTGRKYIVIRAIGDTEVSSALHVPCLCTLMLRLQTEKGVDAQKRLIKDFYETVDDFTPR